LGLLLAGAGAGILYAHLLRLVELVPQMHAPGSYRPALKTKIYSSEGELLLEVFDENREFVPYQALPPPLVQATLALEDKRFYEHHGLDFRGIVRAFRENWRQRRWGVQGGSTITQQLARSLYLGYEKTLARKISEALLALQLERAYSKEEILELYLNQINYGHGAYGVYTAAKTYFNKRVQDLTLPEAALLVVLPRQPSRFSPFADPDGARQQRAMVLELMMGQGWITPRQALEAQRAPLGLVPPQPRRFQPRRAPYFALHALKELLEEFGEKQVLRGGLRVYTTLDLTLQETADRALQQALRRAARQGAQQGAVVLLDPHTGAIQALVGGGNFGESEFNRATQALRQPGSAFKVFVYTAAIDLGLQPTDVVQDEPLAIQLGPHQFWRPHNYDDRFHGPVTLTTALAQSINIPAIKLLQQVGVERAIQYAQILGIRSPLRPHLSLALGTSEVTLLDLTAAYGVFATGGRYVRPTTILKVVDERGTVIRRLAPRPRQVLKARTAQTMAWMLQQVIRQGTGRAADVGLPAGGKTGTTSAGRDAWFIGFTPNFAAGVWVGRDDNRPMRGVWGGNVCAPVWATVVKKAQERLGRVDPFPAPEDLARAWSQEPAATAAVTVLSVQPVLVSLCPVTGKRATASCPEAQVRAFRPGTEPQETCDRHRPAAPLQVLVCAETRTLATPWCPRVRLLQCVRGTEPLQSCERHTRDWAAAAKAGTSAGQEKDPAVWGLLCPESGQFATRYCPTPRAQPLAPGQEPRWECFLH